MSPKSTTSAVLRSFAGRFWSKVNKTDSCWLWTGSTQTAGYGQFADPRRKTTNGKVGMALAHRVAWELQFGPVPAGKDVLHNCDVRYERGDISYRKCVRGDHLYLGGAQSNIRHMFDSGRKLTKLNPDKAKAIRLMAGRPRVKYAEMAKEFDVSIAAIADVVKGRTWPSRRRGTLG